MTVPVPVPVRVRFMVHPSSEVRRPSFVEPTLSPTEWTDCAVPRVGDTTTVLHEGETVPVLCRPAAITWERIDGDMVQVFTVRVEVGS